ncbi:Myotubularin-Related Protein 2 [Manis pentadactyla]|nr:Myotubularin-Related Protein 2 [Manis pentadactyla]
MPFIAKGGPKVDASELGEFGLLILFRKDKDYYLVGICTWKEVYITKHLKAIENSNAHSRARELFTERPSKRERRYTIKT